MTEKLEKFFEPDPIEITSAALESYKCYIPKADDQSDDNSVLAIAGESDGKGSHGMEYWLKAVKTEGLNVCLREEQFMPVRSWHRAILLVYWIRVSLQPHVVLLVLCF